MRPPPLLNLTSSPPPPAPPSPRWSSPMFQFCSPLRSSGPRKSDLINLRANRVSPFVSPFFFSFFFFYLPLPLHVRPNIVLDKSFVIVVQSRSNKERKNRQASISTATTLRLTYPEGCGRKAMNTTNRGKCIPLIIYDRRSIRPLAVYYAWAESRLSPPLHFRDSNRNVDG